MNAKAVRVERVAEIRDGSHSIDSSCGRPVAMDIGQRNCYSTGEEQENKTVKTNGTNRKKHVGSKRARETESG
jgi:hypothetical protein